MEDIKESKKVLTDYMLELNADIQRAEDWANTGADEEIYFALKTVLDRLEQLEKEKDKLLESYNERVQEIVDLEAKIEQLEKENVIYASDNNYLMENSIPKSVIREKIEELEEFLSTNFVIGGRAYGKSAKNGIAIAKMYLEKLLGEKDENRN